jgi:hypothetical protein
LISDPFFYIFIGREESSPGLRTGGFEKQRVFHLDRISLANRYDQVCCFSKQLVQLLEKKNYVIQAMTDVSPNGFHGLLRKPWQIP